MSEKIKIFTTDDVMNNIKDTHKITLYLKALPLFQTHTFKQYNNDDQTYTMNENKISSFVIDMKDNCLLSPKNISSFRVSINLDQKLLNNVSFQLEVGSNEIYNNEISKTNDVIPTGCVITNNQLCYSDVKCILFNINDLVPYLEQLIFSIDITYVDFTVEYDLCSKFDFLIHKDDKINRFRIMGGMGACAFDCFLSKKDAEQVEKISLRQITPTFYKLRIGNIEGLECDNRNYRIEDEDTSFVSYCSKNNIKSIITRKTTGTFIVNENNELLFRYYENICPSHFANLLQIKIQNDDTIKTILCYKLT